MSRRPLLAAATCVALLAVPGVGSLPTASATTRPVAVPGTTQLLLKGSTLLGAAPAAARQRVTLSLALRDRSGLDRLLAGQHTPGSADFGRFLSPAQFAARFSPSTSVVELARSWATGAGLHVDEVSSNRTLVTVSGTRAQLGHAFGVQLRSVRVGGTSYVTPDRTATLPVGLRSATAAVLGLTTYRAMHLPSAVRQAAPYQPYGLAAYGPRDFAQIYHAPTTNPGTGQAAAIITQGDLTRVKTDLATFQKRNGLPALPLTVVQTTATSKDVSGADEYDLDSQYTHGFAPGLSTLIAYNSDTLGDIHPLNRFVTDRKAKTASASYGGCEVLNALLGDVAADDQVFKQATAQGQSFWVSSGDEGSSCSVLLNTGTPVGVTDVEYPSSSPYVVAVGGTSLTGQTTQPTREVSWIGGGGGYSNIEAAPAWQKANLSFVPAVGRGVPDVSLDADPNSGFVVVVAGSDTVIGGTSASAPAWNGIWSRVLQAHPALGFAAPVLYRSAGGLVDITLGSNGAFQALPGYDQTTGLGTPDITRLIALAH